VWTPQQLILRKAQRFTARDAFSDFAQGLGCTEYFRY
jgi:hypothetical protein